MDLSGQIAIVTGASRGLGRSFAIALAGAGAHVVITARTEAELLAVAGLIQQSGGQATPIPADVTDRPAVEALVARTEREVGPIDLLINNAATLRAWGPMAEADPDDWWREMEINLRGPLLFMRAVLPHMLIRRRGRIVNVASRSGLHAVQNMSAYAVSKAALIRLTENVAKETLGQGVKVFVIHPGDVHTPLWDIIMQAPEAVQLIPGMQRGFRELQAKDSWTRMEDAVAMLLLVASGQADGLNGCFLSVHDDLPDLIRRADEIQQADRHKLRLRA